MSKIKLHYTPDQLRDINGLMRGRFIRDILNILNKNISGDLPFDLEDQIRIVNNYFDDIDTILNEGEFIMIDEGGIIDEMIE